MDFIVAVGCAKDKIFYGSTIHGKHSITRQRLNANLKYLNEKPRLKGQRQTSRKCDSKVDLRKAKCHPAERCPIVFQPSVNGYWQGLMKNILIKLSIHKNFIPLILTVFSE